MAIANLIWNFKVRNIQFKLMNVIKVFFTRRGSDDGGK